MASKKTYSFIGNSGVGQCYHEETCREGWQDELKELISKLNISVAFDAIAGDMSGTMMQVATDFTMQSTISLFLSDQCCFNKSLIQLLPEGSTTVVYGGLSGSLVIGFSSFAFLFYISCMSLVYLLYFIRICRVG